MKDNHVAASIADPEYRAEITRSVDGKIQQVSVNSEEDIRPATGSGAPPPDSNIVENGLKWTFLAIRIVHLVQGVICVASGWSTYRRPRLAAAVLTVVGTESTWLLVRVIR